MSEREPSSRPRRLLVLDTVGAALTAAIAWGPLASGLVESGVPTVAWWVLGSVAAVLAVTGAVGLWRRWPPGASLHRLAVANLAYAGASLMLVAVFRETATAIIVAYVLLEATVLTGLATAEWRESRRLA